MRGNLFGILMATVYIPAPLRTLTGGESTVRIEGSTLAEVFDHLDERFAGIRGRLVEDGRLRRGMAAFVDGVQASAGLDTKVGAESEIYLSPAISGGSGAADGI